MSAALVPIVVTDSIGSPDGSTPPTGRVQFILTDEITGPQECAAKVIGAGYLAGLIAQQLVANDKDSTGAAIVPATTMYQVAQDIDGATPLAFFITVPAVPPGSRTVADCVTTEASTTISSASANFTDDDIGAYVLLDNGDVVVPGTQIAQVLSSTEAVLTTTPQVDLTGVKLMIGASATLAELRPAP